MDRPLDGLLVLEFAQFMAGPTTGLRLADLGARVIKIERPVSGEAGRQIAIKNLFVDDNGSLVFHTINRNKESYAADLKNEGDLARVKALIKRADVIIHNFRPGIMEKFGLDYTSASQLNGSIVYAVVSGYGTSGPWAGKPGQDLLVQSLSGLTWLTGSRADGPVPFGLAVVDMYCATHLTQGILAGLLKRSRTQQSVLVEVSLMESALDMQFEVLTTHLNDGGKLPDRSGVCGSGHAYLSAPYGVYATAKGYIALAMGDLTQIAGLVGLAPGCYQDRATWFSRRDELLKQIGERMKRQSANAWEALLTGAGVWCAVVNDYGAFTGSDGFRHADMLQEVALSNGSRLTTTRSPLQIDGKCLRANKAAPGVGADNARINRDYHLTS